MGFLSRLDVLEKSHKLAGIRVLVTGCGFKEVRHVFHDVVSSEPSHDAIVVDGKEMKLNIGAAVAAVLAVNGATIHLVSRSPDKLAILKTQLARLTGNPSLIEFSSCDILDEGAVKRMANSLPNDMPLFWVQSVGLGAGSYKAKDENPYLPLEEIPLELIEKESQIVIRSTHLLMKTLLPRFRVQKETRIAIVTSMSAIRGYSLGGTHCAAKGAIDRYANSAMLALYKNNIFVTSIRPGAVDTGLYDLPAVQQAVQIISDEYHGQHRKIFVVAPPVSVGLGVLAALTSPAHIPSINLVAKGQFPNEGS